MTVGLPGTGIGGLFYFVLVGLMPFREAWLTLRGRGTVRGWGAVCFQLGLVALMLSLLWGEAWLIRDLLAKAGAHGEPGAVAARVLPGVGRIAAATAVIVLAGIVAVGYVLEWISRFMAAKRTAVPVEDQRVA